MPSNYPCGVDSTHPYFNPQPVPECQNRDCMAELEFDWEFCPFCGWHIDWENWDAKRGEWKCS